MTCGDHFFALADLDQPAEHRGGRSRSAPDLFAVTGMYTRLRTAPISSSSAGVSTRRKGARINRLPVSGFAVQFDKIDQHQPVRRLTILLGRSKLGALVEPRHPYPQLGLPIPQWGAIGLGLCQVVLQPLLVAQLLSLAQILSLER